MFEEDDLCRKIALTQLPGVGDRRLKAILTHFGSVDAIFNANKEELNAIPFCGKNLQKLKQNKELEKKVQNEANFIRKHKIKYSFFLDSDYPYRLKECSDGPVLFYWKGNVNLNANRIINIVGTRNSTPYGAHVTKQLIEELHKNDPNMLIVSGMAYGIDIIAHRAAVNNNMPTLGVLAHGLDRLYPSLHRETSKQMIQNGGLLTEFTTGTNPDPQNFVKRNRIVAGLADATLVVESGAKGGALITANIAASYNRDVFAFPGNVNSEFSAGCNWLIKTNQAAMIENANDLMRQMNWISSKKSTQAVQKTLFQELNTDERPVFELLRKEGSMALNLISLSLNQPVSKTSVTLFNMEMKGMVQVLPGNVYRLI